MFIFASIMDILTQSGAAVVLSNTVIYFFVIMRGNGVHSFDG